MGRDKQLDDAFFEVLAPEGYSRLAGRPLSYVLRAVGGCERHVDVEPLDYVPAFSVTLQELCPGRKERSRLLEEFEGLHLYRFSREGSSFEDVLLNAIYHLRTYGLQWLSGEEVQTPALAARGQVAAEYKHRDLLEKARTAFKAGDYAEAVQLFRRLQESGPLSALDQKYFDVASKKSI